MGVNPDDLNLIIEQAIQKVLQNNQNTTRYYKIMNKHKKCSKCSTLITTENYKKDRSVCKNCYYTNTLNLMKKRFGLLEENNSSKQHISDIKDSSNKEDNSNKQVRSRKQVSSRKQVGSRKQECSNKEDISINNITDSDPDLLCNKLREISEKSIRLESDCIMAKMIIDELFRVRCITRKQYNTMCEKTGLK